MNIEMSRQSIELDARGASDAALLAAGAFAPLTGFMDHREARSVVESISLPSGELWPLPILLRTSHTSVLRRGARIPLRFDGRAVGAITVSNWFAVPRAWAAAIYGTEDLAHPGVAAFLDAPETAVAGEVEWFADRRALGFEGLTPAETRAVIAQRGWSTVVAFQTRNPIHRAHEYILRTALEVFDGLLLHPLVGETRAEDVPAEVRLRCYDVLLERYLPRERVLFTPFDGWMRYGGPREAVLHAVVRRNFGATHILIGRDHAGVGGFYGPFDAQKLLRSVRDRLGIEPVFFDQVFYCASCDAVATRRTCAHEADGHLLLSGTEVRRRLRSGETLPKEFTRPEVAEILRGAYAEVRDA
jgi:sulfate adenylyltransferase